MGNLIFHRRKHDAYVANDGPVDFSNFTILRSIGRGSYGKVCIAQKRDTKKLYAMKYMNKAQCIKEGAVTNILQELRLLRMIEFPHIVNLRFAFHDIEDMCLVIDLLQGGDLRYHLTKIDRFSERDVSIYLLEISSALQYLRELQIVHRDVKPDNLLLGLDGHIHLTDFNVATQLRADGMSRSECGTWQYMAPEIFMTSVQKLQGYSYSVDWWSLAITCYELSHGQRPFNVPKYASAAVSMFSQTKVRRFSSSLSSQFTTVLEKMLVSDAKQRLMDLSEISSILNIQYEDVTSGKITPDFTPSVNSLNVDPAYELEELIIESKPIHKKQSRLSKTSSMDGGALNGQRGVNSGILALIEREFEPYDYLNRSVSVPNMTPSMCPPDQREDSDLATGVTESESVDNLR